MPCRKSVQTMRQIPRSEQGRERSPRNFVDEQMKMQRIRAIKQNGLRYGYEGEGRVVSGAHHGHVHGVAFHLEDVEHHPSVYVRMWRTLSKGSFTIIPRNCFLIATLRGSDLPSAALTSPFLPTTTAISFRLSILSPLRKVLKVTFQYSQCSGRDR